MNNSISVANKNACLTCVQEGHKADLIMNFLNEDEACDISESTIENGTLKLACSCYGKHNIPNLPLWNVNPDSIVSKESLLSGYPFIQFSIEVDINNFDNFLLGKSDFFYMDNAN